MVVEGGRRVGDTGFAILRHSLARRGMIWVYSVPKGRRPPVGGLFSSPDVVG